MSYGQRISTTWVRVFLRILTSNFQSSTNSPKSTATEKERQPIPCTQAASYSRTLYPMCRILCLDSAFLAQVRDIRQQKRVGMVTGSTALTGVLLYYFQPHMLRPTKAKRGGKVSKAKSPSTKCTPHIHRTVPRVRAPIPKPPSKALALDRLVSALLPGPCIGSQAANNNCIHRTTASAIAGSRPNRIDKTCQHKGSNYLCLKNPPRL